MLNISLQSRPDNTVRPIAIQIGTRTENLPQASPRHLEILESSIEETAKTGNLSMVLAMLQTRAIIKGASPTRPASRKAIVLTTVLEQIATKGEPGEWETFAKEKGFAVEEVSAALPTARLILDLTRGNAA
ncbi:MAG: hypothetical protein NTX57_05855 [Armatimonadetes bacterium]|nr:hypothetical protein [Armatimonadota bacterium]